MSRYDIVMRLDGRFAIEEVKEVGVFKTAHDLNKALDRLARNARKTAAHEASRGRP